MLKDLGFLIEITGYEHISPEKKSVIFTQSNFYNHRTIKLLYYRNKDL